MKNLVLSLFLFQLVLPVFAGNNDNGKAGTRTVTGRVLGPEGETLPGAAITVKETGDQVFADLEGRFQICLPAGELYSVSISTIGYQSKEVMSNDIHGFAEHTLQPLD